MAALCLASPGSGDIPEHRAGPLATVGFAIKGAKIAGGAGPDPYAGRRPAGRHRQVAGRRVALNTVSP